MAAPKKHMGTHFGQDAEAYDKGRPEYSPAIMGCVFAILGNPAKVLDIGCGTGIATRQLHGRISGVVGSDADSRMIEVAKRYADGISYFAVPAHNLPFQDGRFDAVTAFEAFHWFCNDESAMEIRRVLKTGGTFIVVHREPNRKADGYFYEATIEKLIGNPLPDNVKISQADANYNPAKVLAKAGFHDIAERSIIARQNHAVGKELARIQTKSIWAGVPESLRQKALQILEAELMQQFPDGQVKRNLPWEIITARK